MVPRSAEASGRRTERSRPFGKECAL